MPFGKFSYLTILLLWAMPVVALQWAVAAQALWRARRLLLATVLICGGYLSVADHLAIARGIWQIRNEGIMGLRLAGRLPLEEAMFFFLTTILCAQGFVMLAYYFKPRGARF